MISAAVVLLLLFILGAIAIPTTQKVLAFGSAISTQSSLSTQTGYMGTSDRVNILVMGYGGSGHDGAYLTDSMMVMSLIPQSHHTTLISVPRDLWVQNPANSGNYTKINAVYPVASNNNANPVAGGDAAAQKVSLVTGLDIKYWMTINFAGFRDFINAIGGVDVNVPDSFKANYPAYLTDSMMVMSLMPQSHHTTLISVPRDLWVQNPANSGNYTKINAVYPVASNNNADPVAGGDAAAQKVSLVTGLDIKYWMTINFAGFRDFINAIGGVDVNVPDSFKANYPANDDPSINASWKTIQFTKGLHHMDGETAIEYARARYVIDNPAEGTDFARSARQQLIMKAALAKLKDWHTWPSFFSALRCPETYHLHQYVAG